MTLDEALASTNYLQLFETLGGQTGEVLLGAHGSEAINSYALDERHPVDRRFLAAELIRRQAPRSRGPVEVQQIIDVYTIALQRACDGGPWGLPGRWEGPAMDHLVELGPEVQRALAPLLCDERKVAYTGSIRAALGRVYAVRVKDLAAHAVVRALARSLVIETPIAQRDAAIRRLAAIVNEAP